MMNFRNKWVLVTGASSGLGLHIAELLGKTHGAKVVLVARRRDRLEALAASLEESKVETAIVVADLSKLDQVDRAFEEATAGRTLYGAVLNAGVTHFGRYEELSWDRFEQMLATNVTAVVRLTTKLIPHIEASGEHGGIMIVSSMAGLTPVPYQTAYSGTKAFLVNYGTGLHHELKGRKVSMTTFVPGGIQTEMTSGERFVPLKSWLMPVDPCARDAVDAFRRRRYLRAPGLVNRFGGYFVRLLPQRFIVGQVAAQYRKALRKVEEGKALPEPRS